MAYYPRNSTLATWKELERFVQEDRRYVGRLYKYFERKPFTTQAFQTLQNRGINLSFVHLEDFLGEAEINRKTGRASILIREDLNGFHRDVTLLHELMHLWYDPYLDDSPDHPNKERALRNSARTEWLARKYRANPDLLRAVINGFSLPRQIYDCASYEAFIRCRNGRDDRREECRITLFD